MYERMSRRRALSLIDSFNYAIEGLIHVLRTHRNMRIHFAVAIVVLVAAVWKGVNRFELIALLIAITFVLVAEMINSAIEQAIDLATTSFDPLAKLAKDIAAGAVLIATITAVAVGYLVFSRPFSEPASSVLDRLRDPPTEVTLIALVLVADRDRDEGVDRTRDAAPRRPAVRARRGRVRRLDGGDVHRRRGGAPFPRLVDHVHHGSARRPDPDRGRRPLDARGRLRRASSARSSPSPSSSSSSDGDDAPTELYDAGRRDREQAYAPYSKFLVGAAVRARDGRRVPRRERRERGLSARRLRREDGAHGGGHRRLPTGRPRGDRDQRLAVRRLPPVAVRVRARPGHLRARGRRASSSQRRPSSCRTRSSCEDRASSRSPDGPTSASRRS